DEATNADAEESTDAGADDGDNGSGGDADASEDTGEETTMEEASPPAAEAGLDTIQTKECIFCGEWIPSFADRCSHCSGFLPIAEGRAFSQHFFFFVCCLAMFLGSLMAWEGAWFDSYGSRSIGGAFLMVFAGYGMVASYFNIFHRQMIVWPAILAAFDGAFVGWRRVIQLATSDAAKAIDWSGDLPAKKRALIEFLHLFGPGLYLVVIFSTLFWFTFVVGVIKGGKASAARKEAEREARAAKKKAR
ncbi:MAG: hypothetical protein ACYTG4_07010, partial [Planctomycetota bacterium]